MKHFWAIFVLLMSIVFCHKGQCLRMLQITPPQNVAKGATVTLTCILENAINHVIGWKHSSPAAILSVDSKVAADNVLQYTANRQMVNATSTIYSLEIRNISELNAGSYECVSLLETRQRIEPGLKVDVNILVSQEISTRNVFVSSNQRRAVGDNVILQCSAKNIRPESCYWLKIGASETGSNLMLTQNGRTIHRSFVSEFQTSPTFNCNLRISSVRMQDHGVYRCAVLFSPYERFDFNVRLDVYEDVERIFDHKKIPSSLK